MTADPVFIEPSAAGPTQTLENNEDGTVHVTPGKGHEAREGKVSNPGVRTVSSAHTGPRCPSCNEATLKMRMNRPVGKRTYCSNKDCNYDQSSPMAVESSISGHQVKVMTDRSPSGDSGVKILKQTGPR